MNISNLTESFPEFVKVYEYILPIDKSWENDYVLEYRRLLEKLFQKVTFESVQDVNKKIEAFKLLYSDNNVYDDNEKSRIFDYLHMNYEVSSDSAKRVKANNLYKEFINYMLIPYENTHRSRKG